MKYHSEFQDIQVKRIRRLNDNELKDGSFVVYWMQRAQRVEYNHALEFSVEKANEIGIPLVVLFCLTDDFPEGNSRHYRFMLEGLKETKDKLKDKDVNMVVRKGDVVEKVLEFSDEASILVTDSAYLDFLKGWRKRVSENIEIPMIEVETDLIVPIEEASLKEEYAARTIRPKINEKLNKYLKKLKKRSLKNRSLNLSFEGFDLSRDIDKILSKIDIDKDKDVKTACDFKGGNTEAKKLLKKFIDNKLNNYPEHSNDPSKDSLSDMSPYLHFGQISPLYVALKVKENYSNGIEEYLEQLIIRRELAYNFVYYNDSYDSIDCLPEWAKKTLENHREDEREYIYGVDEFENAATHDEYWNAAQIEMIETGKMHGYMRMYWGKKILEWSETPEKAYETALYLNNKYELDGRDANGFAGVAWCFGKHDQGWKERKVYGKVRYMTASGLERKFDIGKYVEKIKNL